MKIEHVLVPTDLSPESLRPLQEAADLVRASGGRLTLLTVVPDLEVAPHGAPLAPPLGDPSVAGRLEEARAELSRIAADLAGVEVEVAVLAAPDVAQAVVDEAVGRSADLVALSTHGHTGWRRWALGSVAEQVVRRCPVPVLSFQRPEEQ